MFERIPFGSLPFREGPFEGFNNSVPLNRPDVIFDFSNPAFDLSTLTCTTASVANYFDHAGIIKTAAINTPRVSHVYENGSWENKGLLVAPEVTSLILDNRDLTTGNWTASNNQTAALDAVGLDAGANSATTLSDLQQGQNGLHEQSGTFSSAPSAGTVFTFCIPVALGSNTSGSNYDPVHEHYPRIECRLTGGTAVEHRVWVNRETGAITDDTTNAEGTSSVIITDNWALVYVRITSVTGNTDWRVRLRAAAGEAINSVSSAATGTSIVDMVMLYEGTHREIPFAVGSSAVTRNADIILINGSQYSDIFGDAQSGTMLIEFRLDSDPDNSQYIFAFGDGSNEENIAMYINSPGRLRGLAERSNVVDNELESVTGAILGGTDYKAALSWLNGAESRLHLTGTERASDSDWEVATGADTLNIGSDRLDASQLKGYIKSISFWPSREPSSTCNGVTL